ncbi:hypothetical protein DFP79_1763 [Marinomonas balearica]|uniref:Uncharacterized protein n=1 Tax=Marinomonas balearica TaxID=491947 RepID=A0A4R6MBR4_9GAMM|nr:hypothetical protein DFP79_1763 [Marinomonas balearica]
MCLFFKYCAPIVHLLCIPFVLFFTKSTDNMSKGLCRHEEKGDVPVTVRDRGTMEQIVIPAPSFLLT